MEELVQWWGVPAVGVIMGAVHVLKGAGFPARYGGLLAMGLGVAGGFVMAQFGGQEMAQSLFMGFVAGLVASGAYSTGKNAAGR